jgi:hypothetical protein
MLIVLSRLGTCTIAFSISMRARGVGHWILAFVAMAYLGPAIAVATHVIARGGYLSRRRKLSWSARIRGVLKALALGLLWLPTLVLLLVRAAIGR